jgi:thymidylate synthase
MRYSKTATGLGAGWLHIAKRILQEGKSTEAKGQSYLEIKGIILTILKPLLPDAIIETHADPTWLAWMKENFTSQKAVKDLGNARSYASRLYKYAGQKDQIAWVINRLKENSKSRSATITTLEPTIDESYVPCVSLLDFDVNDGSLDLYVYCRSLDFGKKAYGNLVCLAEIQRNTSEALNFAIGRMFLVVKSAHIYKEDRVGMTVLTESICDSLILS